MSKRILVTGGAGFIGSNLVRRLVKEGNDVIVADNFYTGRKENLEGIGGVEVIRHDITIPLYVEVDQIYHLACPASPVAYQKDPVQTLKTNVHGTINMLGLAKRVGARILLTSTSEVYGNPAEHPQSEGYWGNVNPIGIRSCYDEGKRCAETLMMDYHRKHGVETRIARIFNTYGPNMQMNDGRVISNFIVQSLKGDAITIYGNGSQTRSFCYVDDMVDGLTALMNSWYTEPVNLGNPNEMTVNDIAVLIRNMTDTDSVISYRELPEDDPVRRKPNIHRAMSVLGWTPMTNITDGLERTISYFRGILGQDKGKDISSHRVQTVAHTT